MSADEIDTVGVEQIPVEATRPSETNSTAPARFDISKSDDPSSNVLSPCSGNELLLVDTSACSSSSETVDVAHSTSNSDHRRTQGHTRSSPTPFVGNFSSSGCSPRYNAWHVDPAIVYASNSYGNYSFTPGRGSKSQNRYGCKAFCPALYNTQTSVMSSVQVPRSLKDHISQNTFQKGAWPGYHPNRPKKSPGQGTKHSVRYHNEPEFIGSTLHGQQFRQVVQNSRPHQSAEGSSDAARLTTSEVSFPASPTLSVSVNKSEAPLDPEVLTKLQTGQPIPAAVPSLFAGPSLEEALEQSLYNPNQTTNVYIRGLPPDTTDEKLFEICERFGEISSSKAIVDINTNLCKGFGFACYRDEVGATACIAGLIHCGYQVSFAKESFSTRLKNLQDPRSTNLYLSNLPMHIHEKVRHQGLIVNMLTRQDLEELFQPYKVISNRVLRDSNNISRGVGFARLADRESAEAIIAKFDNTSIGTDSSGVPLQVRFADSPNQKRLKGQTQRRRQWRAREYNLLTGYLEDVQSHSVHRPFDHVDYMSVNSVGPTYESMYRADCEFATYYDSSASYPYEVSVHTDFSKCPQQIGTVDDLSQSFDQSLTL